MVVSIMYVFTHEPLKTDRKDVTFVSSIEEYLDRINQNTAIKRVWLLGGAQLVAAFKAYDLIDECIITVIPKILHEGIALPNVLDAMIKVESKQFSEGIVEQRYIRKG